MKNTIYFCFYYYLILCSVSSLAGVVNNGSSNNISEAMHALVNSMLSPSRVVLEIDSGVVLTLGRGTIVNVPGDLTNLGTLVAESTNTFIFSDSGNSTLRGATTFYNLRKIGAGFLSLKSSITVNGSLLVLEGAIHTQSSTITFGPNGSLNGHPMGGQIIASDTIVVPAIFSIPSEVSAGWNLVSVPVVATDQRKIALFPSAVSNAFFYNNGYQLYDTLQGGKGFWLKFPRDTSLMLIGGGRFDDAIPVEDKWNIIGTNSFPVPVSNIVTDDSAAIISDYFGFSNTYGYQAVKTLQPGKAYWVKVRGAGTLIMQSGSARKKINNESDIVVKKSPKNITSALSYADNKDELSSMTITDAKGRQRTLYFTSVPHEKKYEQEVLVSELPPVPPAGSFDARFSSQKTVTLFDESKPDEQYAIVITSPEYPLTISFDGNESPVLLMNGKEVIPERNDVIVTQALPAPIQLKLSSHKETTIPEVNLLEKNYPNPFNPSTVINYQLSVASTVKLKVYNILGEEVFSLIDGIQDAGYKSVTFDASGLSSGIYFYKLEVTDIENSVGTFTSVQKMLLVK